MLYSPTINVLENNINSVCLTLPMKIGNDTVFQSIIVGYIIVVRCAVAFHNRIQYVALLDVEAITLLLKLVPILVQCFVIFFVLIK